MELHGEVVLTNLGIGLHGQVVLTYIRDGTPAPAGAEALARRLIFSHHIIAPSKRAGLRQLAVSLGVTALVKIGWPGIIVLEGDADRVEAYVGAIQGWRWKKLAVRGEQELDDGEERALPRVFLELDDMSALAQIMRDAGLEDLFRRVFK